jgi:hypothetical protein
MIVLLIHFDEIPSDRPIFCPLCGCMDGGIYECLCYYAEDL